LDGLLAAVAPRTAALVGFGGRCCLRTFGHHAAQASAFSQSGVARVRTPAASDSESGCHGCDFFPLRHPNRLDHAAARQGRLVACVSSRFVQLLDRSAALAGGTQNHETAILKHPTYQSNSMSILAELWKFLRVRKKFWLLPIAVVLLVFGGLMILVQGSAVAPFIYTLF